MVTRWSEKSPGLKILWIWTLGTAAVLITNVVTTRMRDMEKLLNEEDATMRSQSSAVAVVEDGSNGAIDEIK
ncbi:hypothetical protein IHE45_04G006600 [Dioscorea alata]|uniref:Uncharacterized protein n=3 Tax=Dioscorea alata TaxID=55571 RepID=A0ACB7WB08_DIOAL|nr:hypothetical protein IHE45_04G006600 [Dioscorea alata]KAH7684900.1 hypothetical protein IHE45_04G006600 [Dioscorea alata]KAH7684901.1 hypothetical protein IHE45_04G006600 [Dioscorea alata]